MAVGDDGLGLLTRTYGYEKSEVSAGALLSLDESGAQEESHFCEVRNQDISSFHVSFTL